MSWRYGQVGAGGRRSPLTRLRGYGSPLRRFDWVLLAAVLALSVFGMLLVWSATRPVLLNAGRNPQSYLEKDLLTVAIGLALAAAVSALDYRLVRAYAPILYAGSCAGLVLVLTPLGSTIKGHHSWIEVGGGFQFQPSEFAKLGLVVLLAVVLGEPHDGRPAPPNRDVVLALALAGLVAGLILMQPDLGTTMVLAVIVMAMVAISGVSKRWLLALAGAGVAAALAAVRLHLLKQYQINRFIAFADPSADPKGAGYNAAQARIAVGSGGLTGQGLFHGRQTGGLFVPEQHTDFIFTVAGEEFGFLGATFIVLLLGVVFWRGLRIAVRCRTAFGTLVATGIVSWLAFQTFENIGMTVGIMPITGVPLPYISYGGSATVANMIAFGILEAVHLRQSPLPARALPA